MKLALAAAHQILVELNAEEQRRYGLAQNRDVREGLRSLLSDLAKQSGKRYTLLQHVRADLLPDRNGGCLLIVSGLEEQSPAGAGRFCFFAETEDDLIDAARAACKAHAAQFEITLLQSDRGYLLLTPALPERLTHLLTEYLRVSTLDEAAEAVLLERSALLVYQRPLSVLCGGA